MLPLYSMTLFILIICFPLPSTELLLFIYTIFIASKQTAVLNPSCLEFCPVLILSEKYSPLCSQSLTNGSPIEWAQQSNVCCCCCQYYLFFLSILYICFVSLMGTAKLMMFTSWNCISKSWISLLAQKAGRMEQVFVNHVYVSIHNENHMQCWCENVIIIGDTDSCCYCQKSALNNRNPQRFHLFSSVAHLVNINF